MSIGAAEIKALREETGAGILDCKKALEETGGNFEQATKILKEKGFAEAQKRADRETHNGILELYNHGDGRVGVIVEVNCETDFVARTKEFRTFAHEVALQIAANGPRYVSIEDIPEQVVAAQQEEFREDAIREGKTDTVVDRIVEGRMKKFYEDSCLLLQSYIRDDTMTVEALWKEAISTIGENISIRRFIRWEMGEEE